MMPTFAMGIAVGACIGLVLGAAGVAVLDAVCWKRAKGVES